MSSEAGQAVFFKEESLHTFNQASEAESPNSTHHSVEIDGDQLLHESSSGQYITDSPPNEIRQIRRVVVGRNENAAYLLPNSPENEITGEIPSQSRTFDEADRIASDDRRVSKREHAAGRKFCCSYCSASFNAKSNLTGHIRTHTGEKPFVCSECSACFTLKSNLSKHMRQHTGEKPFSCSMCSASFALKMTLDRHMRVHTGEKPFSCSECSKLFSQRSSLNRHMLVHTGEKPFNCSICSACFALNSALKRHMLVHSGENHLSSDLCSVEGSSRQDIAYSLPNDIRQLKRVVGERNENTAYPTLKSPDNNEIKGGIPSQSRTFDEADRVALHEHVSNLTINLNNAIKEEVKEAHDNKAVPFNSSLQFHDDFGKGTELDNSKHDSRDCVGSSCSRRTPPFLETTKTFIDHITIQSHEEFLVESNLHNIPNQQKREQAGKKQFCCSYCSASFNAKSNLNGHIRTHTGEKPFVCSECSACFSLKSNLNKHMRQHTGEKPFSCTKCSASFALKMTLDRHMRVHTGEKPFSCSECSKLFPQRSALKRHMFVHTGEKPFRCSICSKSFALNSTLNQHMLVHSVKNNFVSNHCPIESSLKRHITDSPQKESRLIKKLVGGRNENAAHPICNSPDNQNKAGIPSQSRAFAEADRVALDEQVSNFTLYLNHTVKEADDDEALPVNSSVEFHDNIGKRTDFKNSSDDSGDDFGSSRGRRTPLFLETRKISSDHITIQSHEEFLVESNLHNIPNQQRREQAAKKQFCCSYCSASFNAKSNLTGHIRTHTGEKPFVCSECSSCFTLKSNLSKHMRQHTGEKPFNCSMCSASFALKMTLDRHMRVHTGEKPFSCSECSKLFSQRSSLNRHMLVHTGEKPFSCSICSACFALNSALKRHMLVHSGA